jgi:hypothetical protein
MRIVLIHVSTGDCGFYVIHFQTVFATRRVPHVEQGMSSLPEHLSSLPVFSGVRVGRFLVFCVMFCKLLFILFHLATVLSVL